MFLKKLGKGSSWKTRGGSETLTLLTPRVTEFVEGGGFRIIFCTWWFRILGYPKKPIFKVLLGISDIPK